MFQIAYRTASDKFPGKLSELFLVLSDNVSQQQSEAEGFESQPGGRGQKHRLEEDQMSVESSGLLSFPFCLAFSVFLCISFSD